MMNKYEMCVIASLSPYLMQTYHNKRNFNVIENINIMKKLVSLKNNVTKIWPFYNVISIRNSHVYAIQRNSDVIKNETI